MDKDKEDLFLVGDVGGTKTFFSLLKKNQEVVEEKTFENKKFSSFMQLLDAFLSDRIVEKAFIGIAGPVVDEKCKMTNLNWEISKKQIGKNTKVKEAFLMNDLELFARGLFFIKKENTIVLQNGTIDSEGAAIIISVGTGLGEAMIAKGIVFPSEGGHGDYPPQDKEEIAFLQFLQKKYSHVSLEKALSGKGIENMYEFFSQNKGVSAKEIFSKKEKEAETTRKFFYYTLGKEAANFSLKTLPYRGIYLTGGVIEKNLSKFCLESFEKGYFSKGSFNALLKKFPIFCIKNTKSLVKSMDLTI